MSKQNITINDIARIAKVSPSAVSIVLNNKPGVSEATRKHVKDIIESMNYTPNLNSRKLILNKSFNIFIVVDNAYAGFDNMFYNSAVMGILDRCKMDGYNVVLADVTADYRCSGLKRAIDQRNIDGAVFLQDIRDETAEELRQYGLPLVILDSHKRPETVPFVTCDYTGASRKAVEYLIQTGHKDIAFIGMRDIPEFCTASQNGYVSALKQAGFSCKPDRIISASPERNSVDAAIAHLFASSKHPDALFCATDLIGIYALQSLASAGIHVPEEISVCAMDNIMSSQFCSPTLTTIDIEKKKMGGIAVELLMDMINHGGIPSMPSSVTIAAGSLIQRESVRNRCGSS